ncbi:hypothetical protein PCANC_03067 [Puccinia coronata f. sp. avenae]|uniref:Retrovirus-related Pol polyprotein from transposon TNT 1-94-like beta-barrel domain-containing protein n=1 Tax=Puccinia coronata f. sp. avenae TaxID=200324 RepID=A0A2N5SP49_9BASI|nr:hypothetical protein PCASD_21977 [Puccinia coronata f. sp. avenae]PLW57195.1 hypothetical protein PCANC_03067 [Puccinia coronata f. sp. avenae]
MVDLLTDCQEKVQVDDSSKTRAPNPSAFATKGQPERRASVESHPDSIYVMAALIPGTRLRTTVASVVAPPSSSGSTSRLSSPLPRADPANLRVLQRRAPGMWFPTPSTPPGPTNANLRPADYYRPSYSQQGQAPPAKPSAREAELMDYDMQQDAALQYPHHLDEPPAKFAVASSSAKHHDHVLFDTGATHHVTGDRSALTKFEVLPTPIPLNVATNGSSCVITAQGTMSFRGPGSTLIWLRGVLFCEHISHTLVSPVALFLDGFSFSSDCGSDSFLIFFRNLFWTKSTLDICSQKWFLPSPIKASSHPVAHLSPAARCPMPSASVCSRSSTLPVVLSSPVSPLPVYSFNSVPLANNNEPFKVIVPAASSVPYLRPQLTANEKTLLKIHKCFGHVGLHVIRRMMAKHAALGLPDSLPAGEIICLSCIISKSVNKNTLTSDHRSFEPMDAWNVDLIGPFNTPA